jgi:methylmalonyl-CoA mutase C-terminal domain/subunit
VPRLQAKGVSAVFLPGSSTQAIIEWIRGNIPPRAAAA